MDEYNCEKCGKVFSQKSHYMRHNNKKNPCVTESKIKEMKNNTIKEKLIEIIYDNKLVKDVYTKKIHFPKPILKWVGGKTQIIDKLIMNFPVEINNYREVFLGGGSVLLTLLSYIKSGIIKIQGNIYAYDLNEPLIYIYKNIQTHHDELYAILQTIITDFDECGNGEINRTPPKYIGSKNRKRKLLLLDKK